jgi:hypothetical protein
MPASGAHHDVTHHRPSAPSIVQRRDGGKALRPFPARDASARTCASAWHPARDSAGPDKRWRSRRRQSGAGHHGHGPAPFREGITRPSGAGQFSLSKGDWSDVLSGTSALALVKNLPGVTFTSTDAYGLDLSDGFLMVRGFRQEQLGVTFEGIPLNDGSYGSVTGTAPLNVGVTGQIGGVEVSPGSANVDVFSNSVDGGDIQYTLIAPQSKPGLSITQGYGSNTTLVTSLTGHTGQIGDGGPRILLGFERISKDKYSGAGTQSMLHASAKIVQDLPWGDLTAFFSFSHAQIWGTTTHPSTCWQNWAGTAPTSSIPTMRGRSMSLHRKTPMRHAGPMLAAILRRWCPMTPVRTRMTISAISRIIFACRTGCRAV